ncbi:MAG: hypothetical protein WC380_12765 [Pedobacter sp.]|jgi:hypothetical protein
MKKLILAILLVQALFFNPLNSSGIDYSYLPVYTGHLNDPGVTIILEEETYAIIVLDGVEYYFPK